MLMKLDGHIHIDYSENNTVNTGDFIKALHMAGMDGGIVISLSPDCFGKRNYGYSHKQRLDNLFMWVSGNENLYPFYWINPIDEDAGEQVEMAESMGVKGYKVICSSHYPGDARAMKIYKKIADAGKPVLFHSGILWDGQFSSRYNRPSEFEALLEIDRLRFSLAHISWPWVDENIAVYGKFINAYSRRPDLSVEMFIDITPGTPPIYRREALAKLFKIGYDVENNVIFGTDCNTGSYNGNWVRDWMKSDNEIFDELGVGPDAQRKIYCENLKRFIGASGSDVKHRKLLPAE